MTRVAAILWKELADLRRNPGVFVPAMLTGLISLVLPFIVAVAIPHVTGERLADSSDFEVAVELFRSQPRMARLDQEAAAQAWIFQQFLILLVLAPVAASMSIAAAAVIGEKQARTLEPLLATPISTAELLAAKVLGALIPALALFVLTFVVYFAGIVVLAEPGVPAVLLTTRSIGVMFVLGPLMALLALQLAVCVSSRVNDARSAQQIGAVVILPLGAALVGQLTGVFVLSVPVIITVALILLGLNAALLRIAVALFDRESILTRWR